MKRLNARWLSGILLALVLLIGWLLSPRREAGYNGRPVSSWFKEYCRSGQWGGQYDWVRHKEAGTALQKLGSNAVPYLLKQAFSTHEDSAVKSNFYRIVNGLPRSWGMPLLVNSYTMREESGFALKELRPSGEQLLTLMQAHLKSTNHLERGATLFILGTAGDGAERVVPHLVSALKDPDIRMRQLAMQSLGWIGPRAEAAVPGLIEVVTNSGGSNRIGMAVYTLGKIGRPATSAVPVVQKLFDQETNWSSRCGFAFALVRMDPRQTNALAFLIDSVTNHQPVSDRWIAVAQLEGIGPDAKAAVPALLQALKSTNDMLLTQSVGALRKIGVATETILPTIKLRLDSDQETTRANAAARILEIEPGNHEAHVALMKLIEKESSMEKFAIETLGDAGPSAAEALPVLRDAAKQNKPRIGDAAREAIERIEYHKKH